MEAVSKAPADGSVLLFSAISPLTISLHVRKLPFDPGSVAPLTPVMYSPGILAATSATSAKSLAELLAQAKKSPGSVRWGNSGTVSLGLLLAEQLKAASGADIVVVPYKGGGQLVTDALGGHFEVAALTSVPAVLDQIEAGKLRALAVASPTRLKALPQVPTLAELGYPSANKSSYYGLFLPSRVPAPVAQRLGAAVNRILAEPEFGAKVAATGNVVQGGSAAQLAARIEEESRENAGIMRRVGIKSED
jgi:tripartite-type tricarboxylate transporter receptor subunit TctC